MQKIFSALKEQDLTFAPTERFFHVCCAPGALPQAGEPLGFLPANGIIVLTAHIADTLQSVPTAAWL